MINKKYGKVTNSQLQKIDTCLTDFEINHFYQRCNRKLDTILITALKSLKRRRLIEWEYQTVIVWGDQEHHDVATDDEIERILVTEKDILTSIFEYEDIYQIFLSNQQKEFYRLVNERLFREYGYHRYYKRIKIIYNQDNMVDAIPVTEFQLQKLLLNEKVVSYLNNEARNIQTNWHQKTKDYFTGPCPDLYLKAQELLVDELIKPVSSTFVNVNINQLVEAASSLDPTLDSTLDPAEETELDEIFNQSIVLQLNCHTF